MKIKDLLMIVLFIALFILIPFGLLWCINTLLSNGGYRGIDYNFWTWLSCFVLMSLYIGGSRK